MFEAILVAAIAALPPTLMALLAVRTSLRNQGAIREVHVSLNSRLTQLLDEQKKADLAQGNREGEATVRAEIARAAERAADTKAGGDAAIVAALPPAPPPPVPPQEPR